MPSCSSSFSVLCQPASLRDPKCHWLDDITTAGGKQCSNLAGLGHMPTPGIRGEVNSITVTMAERKGKGQFSRVTLYQYQEKENGCWVTKSIHIFDSGIDFSSNSKSSSNVLKEQDWEWLFLNLKEHACSVAQSCSTFYNPIDCRPPGSSVPGIFQARTLEWVAISFYKGSSQSRL